MPQLSRRNFIAVSLASVALLRGVGANEEKPSRWPFYVMDTGLRGADVPSLAEKVALAARLKFDGYEYTLNHDELPSLLDLLDKAKLELEGLYTSPLLEQKIDPSLAGTIARLKGRSTRIELAIRSNKFKPSDPAGDAAAMELLKPISDLCADTGPKACIYPHTGLWTERVDDGVRLARLSGRKNVGANFNLVHWSWVKQSRSVRDALQESLPNLLAVTINGLKGHDIVSLADGDYDLAAFLRTLHDVGYAGPVGLQGYGIGGPSADHLSRSMTAWKQFTSDLK